MSALGIWTPETSLLSTNLEDLPMDRIHIFYTPPEPEIPPTTDTKTSDTGGGTTPLPAATVVEYEVSANDKFKEYIDIDTDINGVYLSSQGFEGIFEISIKYIDISDDSYHEVYKWNDIPSGYQYQIYEYLPPPFIVEDFYCTVKAILSDKTTESKQYYVKVRTNLDRNARMLRKKIQENARHGKTR